MTIPIPTDRHARLQIPALLKFLAARDYTNILVEGGPEVMASFLAANLIDEAHIFIAPIIIGGKNRPPMHAVGGRIFQSSPTPTASTSPPPRRSGVDVHLTARKVEPTPPSAKSLPIKPAVLSGAQGIVRLAPLIDAAIKKRSKIKNRPQTTLSRTAIPRAHPQPPCSTPPPYTPEIPNSHTPPAP